MSKSRTCGDTTPALCSCSGADGRWMAILDAIWNREVGLLLTTSTFGLIKFSIIFLQKGSLENVVVHACFFIPAVFVLGVVCFVTFWGKLLFFPFFTRQ